MCDNAGCTTRMLELHRGWWRCECSQLSSLALHFLEPGTRLVCAWTDTRGTLGPWRRGIGRGGPACFQFHDPFLQHGTPLRRDAALHSLAGQLLLHPVQVLQNVCCRLPGGLHCGLQQLKLLQFLLHCACDVLVGQPPLLPARFRERCVEGHLQLLALAACLPSEKLHMCRMRCFLFLAPDLHLSHLLPCAVVQLLKHLGNREVVRAGTRNRALLPLHALYPLHDRWMHVSTCSKAAAGRRRMWLGWRQPMPHARRAVWKEARLCAL